ncbi:hypothetical protein SAMN02745975_00531 [Geosporobacter subterraneus DSM 17957]|uniref:Uncharacterized protein n=1 Tax=Geosporobacter subterraneus DSM 17957 TaxID=1121919 RepID=A0A1M6DPZ2_9FIRM|nr:hypothetical protein [Geosporobacter subterraneus]SHI75219.1 hypothetical protein SAMN02745975_00531 [Geosporobacter subterraneus DSM 17957]
MLKFNPTTPIEFWSKGTTYIPGQGQTTTWAKIETDGHSIFYGEWRGGFGERAISAQALGVNDMATVRTFYNPVIYNKLRTVQVVIIKNADSTAIKDGIPDKNNPNCYELWGGVDNVSDENQYIEFRVRRYERK